MMIGRWRGWEGVCVRVRLRVVAIRNMERNNRCCRDVRRLIHVKHRAM